MTLMKHAKLLLKDAQYAQLEKRKAVKELSELLGVKIDSSADLFQVTVEGMMLQRGAEIIKLLDEMDASNAR